MLLIIATIPPNFDVHFLVSVRFIENIFCQFPYTFVLVVTFSFFIILFDWFCCDSSKFKDLKLICPVHCFCWCHEQSEFLKHNFISDILNWFSSDLFVFKVAHDQFQSNTRMNDTLLPQRKVITSNGNFRVYPFFHMYQ